MDERTHEQRLDDLVESLRDPDDPGLAMLVGLARSACRELDDQGEAGVRGRRYASCAWANASLLFRTMQLLERIEAKDADSSGRVGDLLAQILNPPPSEGAQFDAQT